MSKKRRRRRIMLMIYSENYELLQQLIDKYKHLSLRNSPSVLPTLEKPVSRNEYEISVCSRNIWHPNLGYMWMGNNRFDNKDYRICLYIWPEDAEKIVSEIRATKIDCKWSDHYYRV